MNSKHNFIERYEESVDLFQIDYDAMPMLFEFNNDEVKDGNDQQG